MARYSKAIAAVLGSVAAYVVAHPVAGLSDQWTATIVTVATALSVALAPKNRD